MNTMQITMIAVAMILMAVSGLYIGWSLGARRGYHEGMAERQRSAFEDGRRAGEKAGYDRAATDARAAKLAGELSAGVQSKDALEPPASAYFHALWKHVMDNYGIALVASEMNAIERAVMTCQANAAIKNLKGDS